MLKIKKLSIAFSILFSFLFLFTIYSPVFADTPDAVAVITAPTGTIRRAINTVTGSAYAANGATFLNYTLSWANGSVGTGYTGNWSTSGMLGVGSSGPITNGNLGAWDTNSLVEGQQYTLRLQTNVSSGTTTAYQTITIADLTPPTVSITSPTNNSNVSGVVQVSAAATDSSGISKVEFYIDNVLVNTTTSSPYTYNWDTTGYANNSSHTITVKAYDNFNNVSTTSSQVTVNDITPPSVSINSPVDNSVVSGNVQLSANASDISGVSKVEFYVDNQLVSTITNAPYTTNWDTTIYANNTSHTVTAKAYDSANNSAIAISTVTVSDITAPAVSITNPTNGSTVSGIVQLQASATDVSGISKVEFYVDNQLLSVGTTPAYTAAWNTTGYAQGTSHTITVKAYDSANNVATTTSQVTVNDITAPSVAITSPTNGSLVKKKTTVTINATASDISGINKVEFRVNGALKCIDTSAAYSCNWTVPNTTGVAYTITATAYDYNGNLNSATSTVTVTSSN